MQVSLTPTTLGRAGSAGLVAPLNSTPTSKSYGMVNLLLHDNTIRTPDSDTVDQLHMLIGGLRAHANLPDLNDEFRAGILFALNKMEEIVD